MKNEVSEKSENSKNVKKPETDKKKRKIKKKGDETQGDENKTKVFPLSPLPLSLLPLPLLPSVQIFIMLTFSFSGDKEKCKQRFWYPVHCFLLLFFGCNIFLFFFCSMLIFLIKPDKPKKPSASKSALTSSTSELDHHMVVLEAVENNLRQIKVHIFSRFYFLSLLIILSLSSPLSHFAAFLFRRN